MNYKSNYTSLNNSFKREFTFRLGYDSGFFSEYNNMVLAILYCLKHEYRFKLSSANSNISNTGWCDFFLPFCQNTTSRFHQHYNFRGHHKKTNKEKVVTSIYKYLTGKFLTQDLWDNFHSRDFESTYFSFPEVGISGDIIAAAAKIVDITWNFQPIVQKLIKNRIALLQFNTDDFAGLHIRRGDKVSEIDNIECGAYMEKLKKYTPVKDVFVATDDYHVYLQLKEQFPDYKFQTFSRPENTGFDYSNYNSYNDLKKRNHLVDLFCDIEVLSMSKTFVGTFSSNIGMYMGMRKGGQNVYGVDFDNWMIW